MSKFQEAHEALRIIVHCLEHLIGLIHKNIDCVILAFQQVDGNDEEFLFRFWDFNYAFSFVNIALLYVLVRRIQLLELCLIDCERCFQVTLRVLYQRHTTIILYLAYFLPYDFPLCWHSIGPCCPRTRHLNRHILVLHHLPIYWIGIYQCIACWYRLPLLRIKLLTILLSLLALALPLLPILRLLPFLSELLTGNLLKLRLGGNLHCFTLVLNGGYLCFFQGLICF